MSFYLTLPSNVKEGELDMENKVSNYKTYLESPLNLYGTWEVAVVKLIYSNSFYALRHKIENGVYVEDQDSIEPYSKPKALFIYTDFIEDQIVGNTASPLLEVVGTSTQAKDETITLNIVNPHYVKINRSNITNIRIMTRDNTGEFVQFLPNSLYILKLHFRPKMV